MKVHMAGKMGDLIYALPVIRALARQNGGKVTLITSALCYQLVPLLWEQCYLADVEMDYGRAYKIGEDGCMSPWAVLAPEEGVNLSPQPAMYRLNAPIPWTQAYAEIAGVAELTPQDRIALPSLWNHRQWYWEHDVTREGRKTWAPPPTAILAPESETLKTIPLWRWEQVARDLADAFTVLVIGTRRGREFAAMRTRNPVVDLRGLTTVSSAAKLLAEAHVAICANSLPWHLSRCAGTPTFCFQDQWIERCMTVDTPCHWFPSEKSADMLNMALDLAPGRSPQTTLWAAPFLRLLQQERLP